MSAVQAPNPDFQGSIAGVQFVDGRAETTNAGALQYFRRAGYTVDGVAHASPAPPEPIDARDVSEPTRIGMPLRDAAVDPRPGDYRAPSNAGREDPHGPAVISR